MTIHQHTGSQLAPFYGRLVNADGCSALEILTGWVGHVRVAAPSQPAMPVGAAYNITLQRFEFSKPIIAQPDMTALPCVRHMLLHGSQATDDSCEFSDVDVLVVLDDSKSFPVAAHNRTINELKRLLASMYDFDSLMHHGFMFMPLSELKAYNESFLPLETLRLAKVLFGPTTIGITTKTSELDSRRISAAVHSLRTQIATGSHRRSDYQLKNFLSGVLLLPALFLASRGQFMYKRESFARACPHFSEGAWSFMSTAEEIRGHWRRPNINRITRLITSGGHPRTKTLISAILPTKINIAQLQIQQLLSRVEKLSEIYFHELEALLR